MKVQTPEISWYARKPILSLDFQQSEQSTNNEFRLATAGFPDDDKYIRIWRIWFEDNRCASDIKAIFLCGLGYHETPVNIVKFSPTDPYLAAGDSDGMVVIWKFHKTLLTLPDVPIDDGEDERPIEEWKPWKIFRDHLPRQDVLDVAWSPDGTKLLSCGMDHCLIVWDIKNGTKVLIKEHENRDSMGVAWDPKSEFFVSLSNSRAMNIYAAVNCQRLFTVTKSIIPSLVDAQKQISSKLFYDDSLFSFARRFCFSPCGELLFAPAGVIEENTSLINATYIFTRLNLKQPAVMLTSKKEIPFAVRCCPKLFKLHDNGTQSIFDLPYRIVFVVLTKTSVILYDTQSCQPVAFISGFQYGRALDLAWTSDGTCIAVTAEEGYCSFIRFDETELGIPLDYVPKPAPAPVPPEPLLPSPPSEPSPKRNTLQNWLVTRNGD